MSTTPFPIEEPADPGGEPAAPPPSASSPTHPSPRLPAVLAVIAVGGVAGAEARHGLSVAWPPTPDGFPTATLLANLTGCALIGVLMVVLLEVRERQAPLLRAMLGVGVLGGYTTFSTFSVDTLTLVGSGHVSAAVEYVLATTVGGLLAVAAGVAATRFVAVRTSSRARGRRRRSG